MKFLKLIFFVLSLLLISCENEQDIQSDIDRLRNERSTLRSEISDLSEIQSDKTIK